MVLDGLVSRLSALWFSFVLATRAGKRAVLLVASASAAPMPVASAVGLVAE